MQVDMHRAYDLATEVKRLVNGLIAYLRGNNQLREPSQEYQLDNAPFEGYLPDDDSPSDYLTNDYQTTRQGD